MLTEKEKKIVKLQKLKTYKNSKKVPRYGG